MTNDDPLLLQARRVAVARAVLAASEAELAPQVEAFNAATAGLRERIRMERERLAAEESAARARTVQRYQETGDKHPVPGLGIRLVKTVEYDADRALAWAKQSGLALLLDRKAFEKIAIATPVPGATVVELPQATIAADLGAVLPPEGA